MTLPPLYAVLDAETAARHAWTLPDLAAACLAGGARLLQVRAKQTPSGLLLDILDAVLALAGPAGARVIVNDRADLARMARAHGVHVGQDDLPPAAVRRVVPEGIVGLSTHTPAQIERAATEPIDYLAVGPVFGSITKQTGYAPVGLELVAAAHRAAAPAGRPVVAIGGITLDTAPAVLTAGASSVAVIGDLFTGGDPERRVRAFVDRLGPSPRQA